MADMEKVLKGLVHCSEMNGENCSKCPYQNESLGYVPTCTGHLALDALELLKAQQGKIDGLLEDLATAIDDKESALLMLKEKQSKSPTWRRGKAFCGGCGGCLENKEQHSSDIVSSIRFCKWCGTPVNWSNE